MSHRWTEANILSKIGAKKNAPIQKIFTLDKLNVISFFTLLSFRESVGVVLHPPNCNAGELLCIGPGRWNMGLESQPGRELLLTLWRWNDGSVMTKCAERNAFWKIPKWQRSWTLWLSHTVRRGQYWIFHSYFSHHKLEDDPIGHYFSARDCWLLGKTDITRVPTLQAPVKCHTFFKELLH